MLKLEEPDTKWNNSIVLDAVYVWNIDNGYCGVLLLVSDTPLL